VPTYFFDVSDGEHHFRDDEGSALPSRDAARKQALRVFPDMVRNKFPDGNRRDLIVNVRNETGKAIFTATLTLTARWLENLPEDQKARVEAEPRTRRVAR
jgi:hypothetical protein